MRLFVAVDVPADIKDAIERHAVDVLRPVIEGARWTRPDGRHLTLKFLGEVADQRVDEVVRAVALASSRHEPFDAAFQNVGGFPNLKRPRVLWIGLGPGADRVAALAKDVEEEFVPLNFELEKRPFNAHLTLARFPAPHPLEVPAVEVPDRVFSVDEVHLYRSKLHPKGARYSVIASSKLGS